MIKYKVNAKDSRIIVIVDNPESVYCRVSDLLRRVNEYSDSELHYMAENAQCWCELAYEGEIYNEDDFSIEIVDD